MTLKKIFKYSILLIITLILIFTLSVAGHFGHFYYENVRPYKPIINDILANAEPEHKNLPHNVKKMIFSDISCNVQAKINFDCDTTNNLNFRITRLLEDNAFLLFPQSRDMKMMDRHIFQLFLIKVLVVRLEDEEKYMLIAELTRFTNEHTGFNKFSKHYFNKPLSQLSLGESAELVAITRAPSIYLRDKEKLEQRKNYLLEN